MPQLEFLATEHFCSGARRRACDAPALARPDAAFRQTPPCSTWLWHRRRGPTVWTRGDVHPGLRRAAAVAAFLRRGRRRRAAATAAAVRHSRRRFPPWRPRSYCCSHSRLLRRRQATRHQAPTKSDPYEQASLDARESERDCDVIWRKSHRSPTTQAASPEKTPAFARTSESYAGGTSGPALARSGHGTFEGRHAG